MGRWLVLVTMCGCTISQAEANTHSQYEEAEAAIRAGECNKQLHIRAPDDDEFEVCVTGDHCKADTDECKKLWDECSKKIAWGDEVVVKWLKFKNACTENGHF
jgi:hypothetical protein